MQTSIDIYGKTVHINITAAAASELAQRVRPLIAEMELYFSCLIRKKVRFREQQADTKSHVVMDNLSVVFRPVMTKVCGKDYDGDEPPLTDFPIRKVKPYVPRWLSLDYKDGHWVGDFGYT